MLDHIFLKQQTIRNKGSDSESVQKFTFKEPVQKLAGKESVTLINVFSTGVTIFLRNSKRRP